MLSAESAGAYLRDRGVADRVDSVESLGGGVSNIVLAVIAGDRRLVVKQSLPELRVADHWPAKRERALTEAAAIELCGRLVPGSAPGLVDVDPEACALVVERAPQGWTDWKSELLSGRADPAVAASLGTILAGWHRDTLSDARVAARFADAEAFEQLRVDPYYRTVMRRRPELAGGVEGYVERMLSTRRCLVHGDYSPKNVLTGDGMPWVIDFEVAHTGDPAFDLAFMLNHLMLKAIHRPQDRDAYRRCAMAFWDAYDVAVPDPGYVLGHTGCLMVARVDGKSPAEYLTEPGREAARSLGSRLLLDPPDSLASAWKLLRAEVPA